MKGTRLLLCAGGLAGFTFGQVRFCPGQVLFSAGTYTQNFNSLASSGTPAWSDGSTLPGWYAAEQEIPVTFTNYHANTGSLNTGALYSYGASGSGDRALGALASGGTGNIAFGLRLLNNTAQPITGLAIGYAGEQWRVANTAAQTLVFSYRIGAGITSPDPNNANTWTPIPALDFTGPVTGSSPAALDGNSAGNRRVFSAIPLSGVHVGPGQEIFFRWCASKAASGSGDGLAVDDVTVSFSGQAGVTNPPSLSDSGQPQSCTNLAGTTAAFSVSPDGTPPFAYRWWKGRNPLADTGKVAGALTAMLTVSNLLAAEAGSYAVVITNSAGAVTSATAVLTVIDPAVLEPPASQTCYSGDTAVFSAEVAGTPPLSLQWQKDSFPLSDGDRVQGSGTGRLAISGLTLADQASYRLSVSNVLGKVNSSAASLTIRIVPSGRIAFWDFNDANTPLNSPAPAAGKGQASLLNGVTASWASGTGTDPGATNQGWNTTDYPSATVSNKTAGVQFKVSTLGYTNILVAWEQRNSNTGSKYVRLQYSADGTNFIDADVVAATGSFAYYKHDFTGISAVENNSNFVVRVVSEFESTAANTANNNYVPTSGTNYGTSGTLRFDTFGVYGEAVNPVSSIPLWIQLVGGQVVVTWSNAAFSLQSAPTLGSSSFTNVPGASSPYTNPPSLQQQFYRLKY